MEADGEDGVFLVIIGDEVSEAKSEQMPIPIKCEYLDETHEELDLSDLMDKIEKHGVQVDIKIEPQDSPEEELDSVHLEDGNEDFLEDTVDDNDNDYVPEDDNLSSEEDQDNGTERSNSEKRVVKRYSMRKPWQRQSLVEELRQQYEELKEDPELLINTLTEIMRNVKAPPLPKDHYVMKSINFSCIKCGAITETLPAAGRHYQERHGERYLVCYACGVDFRSTTNLYKHEKRCVAPDASIVLKARAKFVGRKGRGRPFLPALGPPPKATFPCQLCSAVFRSKSTLQSHEHHHRGERPHRCHACPAAYTSQSALLRHTKMHSDAQFICDYCGKSFKIKVALVSHMDSHKQIRKHECMECGRRFTQKCAMLLHVNRVHRNLPPPCACQICPKRYPRMSLLKAHMKRAHNMVLMTRKMFFKTLPKLTEEQVERAKVVLESEAPSLKKILENDGIGGMSCKKEDGEIYKGKNGQTYYGKDGEVSNGEDEESYDEELDSDQNDANTENDEDIPVGELMQYFDNAPEADGSNVIIIQNGEIIKTSKRNLGHYELTVVRDMDNVGEDDEATVEIKEEPGIS